MKHTAKIHKTVERPSATMENAHGIEVDLTEAEFRLVATMRQNAAIGSSWREHDRYIARDFIDLITDKLLDGYGPDEFAEMSEGVQNWPLVLSAAVACAGAINSLSAEYRKLRDSDAKKTGKKNS